MKISEQLEKIKELKLESIEKLEKIKELKLEIIRDIKKVIEKSSDRETEENLRNMNKEIDNQVDKIDQIIEALLCLGK